MSMQLQPSPAATRTRSIINVPNGILAILCLMYFVLYIDRVNIATVAPRMTRELHLSNTQFGLAVSAFAFPYAVFQLVGGWVSDRFGPRRTLFACGIFVCIATIATGLVGGLGSLVAVRLVLGLGEGAAFPTATRAIAQWVPTPRWGLANGITHGAARLGNAVAPVLVVSLLAYFSWRGSFIATGLASIIWIVLWMWLFRDDPRTHKYVREAELALLPSATSAGSIHATSVPWFRLAKRISPVTAVDFCYGWTLWVFLTWLPSFFYTSFHLDLKKSALFSTGVLLGGVVGDTVGGYLSDVIYRRTGSVTHARRDVIVIGLLGAFCFLVPVVLTHQLKVVAVCLSLACFFSELVVGPIWSVTMDIAPKHSGSASGMMNFGFGVAGILSPVVFGKILDATGSWTIPFYGSISLLLIGAVLAFFMRPEIPFET